MTKLPDGLYDLLVTQAIRDELAHLASRNRRADTEPLEPADSHLLLARHLAGVIRKCLTVLDFIGNANRNFRFDLRYRALTGASRREVEEQVTSGFPYLPAGCSIQLDRESANIVLENLRHSVGANFKSYVGELKTMTSPVTLAQFLHDAAVEPEELYRSRDWSCTRLKREAGHAPPVILSRPSAALRAGYDGEGPPDSADEQRLLNAFTRLLHIDDEQRLALLQRLTSENDFSLDALSIRDRRIIEGFMLMVWGDQERDLTTAVERFRRQPAVRDELRELLQVLDDRAAHRTYPIDLAGFDDVPLQIHALYTRDEALAAIGRSSLAKPFSHREGPLWHPPTNTDYFFITLQKSEKYYSPSTRYRDYAISPELFHWESQSTTPAKSPTGQRYIHHAESGSNVMLFVRAANRDAYGRTGAFTFLGPATYQSHTGERPMAIVWRLRRAMPLDVFGVARVAAA